MGIALPRVGRGTQGDTGESELASLSRRAEDSLCWPLSTACGSGTFCALSWEILSLYLSLSLSLSLWNLHSASTPSSSSLFSAEVFLILSGSFAVLSMDCVFFSAVLEVGWTRACESSERSWALCHQGSAAHFHLHSYTHAHTHTEANVSPRREKRGGSARARERRRKGEMLRGRRQEFPGVFKDQTDPL